MATSSPSPTPAVIDRLHQAWNQHDLEAFVSCFTLDYQGVQPCHPDRAVCGRDQVRTIWSIMFTNIPDFRSDLLGFVAQGDRISTEWHWYGTNVDGKQLDLWGVILFEIQDDCIRSGRFYLEPIMPPSPWAGDAIEES